MRRLMTWVLLAALLGLVGSTSAKTVAPFVSISTTPDELDLGTATFFAGIHEVLGALTVAVESNCLHGPVYISTTRLEHDGGGHHIEAGDIYVRSAKIGNYVSMARPVMILPSAKGAQKVELDFQVHAERMHPPGSYEGVVTLTIVPPV